MCRFNDKVVTSRYIDFGKEGMPTSIDCVFDNLFDSIIIDENKRYDIFISIRYSEMCQLQTIPLEIEYGSINSDTIQSKKILINLFDGNDKTIGKGNMGLFETSTELLSDIYLNEGFFVSIKTEQTSAYGITGAGITIKNNN